MPSVMHWSADVHKMLTGAGGGTKRETYKVWICFISYTTIEMVVFPWNEIMNNSTTYKILTLILTLKLALIACQTCDHKIMGSWSWTLLWNVHIFMKESYFRTVVGFPPCWIILKISWYFWSKWPVVCRVFFAQPFGILRAPWRLPAFQV